MILKSLSLNHDADNLHDALGLSSRTRIKCRERLFFSCFANYLQGAELYENEDDAPKEFTTKTGDLSRVLSIINDPLEYEYTLLMFMKLQDMATDASAKHKMLNDSDTENNDRIKLQILQNIHDLMAQQKLSEAPDDYEFVITPSSMNKRIEMVKASRYNWETYYNMIAASDFFGSGSSKPSKGGDFDVDDMLRGLLGD